MQKRQNPYVDDEAEEVHLPLQQEAKKRRGVALTTLEDSSEEDPEAEEHPEAEPPKEDPKTWTVKDEKGNKHTVSIKEVKGKWIYMSSGARILADQGKSAEEVVEACILFGDEADLVM